MLVHAGSMIAVRIFFNTKIAFIRYDYSVFCIASSNTELEVAGR